MASLNPEFGEVGEEVIHQMLKPKYITIKII
jgi:hypothetical protein